MAVLAPFGPGGIDTWSGAAGRCGVVLGVARRARTPEDATDRQPAASVDGSVVVIADVVLDNRRELSAALGLPDHIDVPDSRFVLEAYERWGPEEMAGCLIGAFAVAVVDQRRGGVLLARDHVGTRPLVVHQRPDTVAFASNALALTAFAGVGHDLDRERAAEVLALVFASERTFVEGVCWVGAGETRWIAAGGVRARRWWQPDLGQVVDLGSGPAHADALRAVFEEAVAAKLRTTGRVGVQLSGGLDSGSVAATAARLLAPEPLRTYTSVPPAGWAGTAPGRSIADERPAVEDLAAMHPTLRPRFVSVAGASLFEGYEDLWELGAGPTRNPANRLWGDAIRYDAAADGVTALLTGGLGNLWFSADGPYWLAALFRVGRWPRVRREARSWTAVTDGSGWHTWRNQLLVPLAPGWLHHLAGRRDNALIDNWRVAIALRGERAGQMDVTRLPWMGASGRRRESSLKAIGNGACQADVSAAYGALLGVDAADPTSDRRVIELATTQPEWARRHDGVTRAVVREAMADRLPASILQNRRLGAQLPDWLDRLTEGRQEVQDELGALRDHPPSRDLIDVERLDALVRAWPDLSRSPDPGVVRGYRLALWRALLVSKYLRWFEERGRRVGAAPRRTPGA